MIFNTIVSLYTSRVVLRVLGVEDYGVYGVVGGIVALTSFLNGSMSGATSRFITFELGRGNEKGLKDTFSAALTVHLGIALVAVIILESLGLWYLNNVLVLPSDSIQSAQWVYQFSIISTALTFTQVPYNSCIIAHERMTVYAYIEILNTCLKLLIVFLLVVCDSDKLVLYAFLTLLVNVIIIAIYRFYCISKFVECRSRFSFNKSIIKPMLSFSGWDLYGNMCASFRFQGISLILNYFYSTVANAASSLAGTVNGTVSSLSQNILTAFRPQIIKNYACGDFYRFEMFLLKSLKFSVMLMVTIFIPILIDIPIVISLWLGEIPEYVVPFCRITIFSSIFSIISQNLTIGIHATGKIKLISFISGSLYILVLPFMYLLLKAGFSAHTVYYALVVSNFTILISNIIILKKLVPQISARSILLLLLKILLGFVLGILAAYAISQMVKENIWGLALVCLTSVFVEAIYCYPVILNSGERKFIASYLNTYFAHK